MELKYPCTSRRRGAATSTIVIFFLRAIALKLLAQRGTAAADSGRDTCAVRRDEASHDRHFSGFQKRLDSFLKPFIGFVELRNRFGVARIREQTLPRIDMHTWQSTSDECGGNNFAREHF